MTAPQFGVKEPGRDYPDRPAAFAVIERDGLIALARVDRRLGREGVLDLPGGGLDPGESAAEAAKREVGEEIGLRVELDAAPLAHADHFFRNDTASVNTRGVFLAGRATGEAPELRTEDDHTLVWMDPHEAIARLDRESHAWAVAAWLRRLRGRA